MPVQDQFDQRIVPHICCTKGCVQDSIFTEAIWNGEFRRYSCPRTKKVLKGFSRLGGYINDIGVYNDSWEEHLWKLTNRMEFLGYQIGGDVITPSRDSLEKVRKTSRLTTKKQVKPCYRDHIPTFAVISIRLSYLLKKGKSKQVEWNEAQERALLKE